MAQVCPLASVEDCQTVKPFHRVGGQTAVVWHIVLRSSPLRLEVKLPGRSLVATSVAGPTPQGRLFYVKDSSSSLRFLVDTGAQVSIVPPTRADRANKHGTCMNR